MRTIIEMVSATRLDCVLGSASLMRQAVESEAATALAISKFWACKRTPMMVAEALECLD